MSLPSGYTQLKYIQSSGTQYINTRFNPSGNALRVVMKFRYTAAYNGLSLFGNHTSTPYSLTVYGTRPTFWVGNSSDVSCGPQTEQGVDYTLDATAENGTITAYWNGVKYTASYSGSLYTEQPIFIFGGNSNGALAEAGNGYQLEMFQLYDGGALVRDYVPAKSSEGVVGLYDNVEGVFETNAGSGAFAEGPLASGPVEGTGASLVDGVSFGINDGKCMVGGTGYSISKGRTLVGGTGYDIAFHIKLKDLPVGTIVYLNESGTPVEFYVSKHDYESGLNGSGRTLLVRKDCYDRRAWKSSGSNTYASSSIDSWLNNTYKGLLDSNIQNAIGNTSFKYTPGGNDLTNVKTLSRSVFILSVTELGKTATHANYEGSALPIAQTSGNMLDKVYYNGELIPQWTRSPYAKGTRYVYYCNAGGTCLSGSLASTYGSRPCFTLPADIIVNPSDYTIIG